VLQIIVYSAITFYKRKSSANTTAMADIDKKSLTRFEYFPTEANHNHDQT
jgi:hypothetical protein